MNTEFLTKDGPVAKHGVKHGNKYAHGLSAGALVFLYATFATKSEVTRLESRCDKCDEKRAAQWRKLMDHEVALAKAGVHVVSSEWNANR